MRRRTVNDKSLRSIVSKISLQKSTKASDKYQRLMKSCFSSVSFFFKFILSLFATLLLSRGIMVRLLQRLLLLGSRFRDTRPSRGISGKSVLKRIPPRRSFADRWNSQMLARYIVRRKYASLSLGRKSTHVCADYRYNVHSLTHIYTSSLHRNRFRCAIGARGVKRSSEQKSWPRCCNRL